MQPHVITTSETKSANSRPFGSVMAEASRQLRLNGHVNVNYPTTTCRGAAVRFAHALGIHTGVFNYVR